MTANTDRMGAVSQTAGVFGSKVGETKVVVKYVMFSTQSGVVLWEATCEGVATTRSRFGGTGSSTAPPPVSTAIQLIREKILAEMPILAR